MREFVVELEVDFYKTARDERFEGYKLIWYKVILRAIYDYVLYKEAKSPSLKRLADGAKRWLYDVDVRTIMVSMDGKPIELEVTPFNSFTNICSLLSLDTEGIRRVAKNLSRKDIRKIEFFQRSKYKKRDADENI